MFTYFLSSTYEDLKNERHEAMKAIADLGCKCIARENFIVSADNYREVLSMIDASDKIIFLIGAKYGSVDERSGKSWTELEIEYAAGKGKSICAIKLPAYTELEKRFLSDRGSLTESEIKQCEFVGKMTLHFSINDEYTVYRAVCVYHMGQLEKQRRKEEADKEESERLWREEHSVYDLDGTWYSIHMSDLDPKYLRIGIVKISQTFTSGEYRELEASAINYSAAHNGPDLIFDGDGFIAEDKTKKTSWKSDYEIYENSEKIIGVFVASRSFEGTFEDEIVGKTRNQYGIHEFTINEADEPGFLSGTFRNAADPYSKNGKGAHKAGFIYLFRDRKARDEFVIERINSEEVELV